MNTLILSSLLNKVVNTIWVENFTTIIQRHTDIQIRFIETNDIWCRDFLPIQVGDNKFVQFSLTKDYYPKRLIHQKTDTSPIYNELGIEPVTTIYKGLPIYLDGGNVIRSSTKSL